MDCQACETRESEGRIGLARANEGGITPAPAVVVAPALVRILDADGVGRGLGLLVADREIVTCAHVVNLALGLSNEHGARPSVPVQLDFPFVAPARRHTAEIVAWRPPEVDGSGDIAGLFLHLAPPDGVVPCSLAVVDNPYGHRFQVFGFTPAHDTGVWVSGEIRGPDLVGNLQMGGDPEGGPRLTPGFSGAPVWNEELQAVVGIVSRATIGRTPPGGYYIPSKLLAEAWPEIEARTRPPCPYRGLLPMREADAPHFFGRDHVSARLATWLPQGRLSLLIGPSGCGKSSVVRAGVLPRLRRRGDLWVAVCRPGVAPFDSLVAALAGPPPASVEAGKPATESRWAQISHAFETKPSGAELAALLERFLEETGLERLFLVIDQFEELLGHSNEIVEKIVQSIGRLAAASRPDGRPLCSVVLVARSDFADDITEITALGDALALSRNDPGEGVHHLLPMTNEELRQAVEQPVKRLRVVRYEDGLVDRLMRDIRRLGNPLAPLAFTLTKLWDYQRAGRISLSAYENLGEVAGALRMHFDRVYDEELDATDRVTAQLLLLRLTAPDGRGGYVRRPVRRDELDEPYWEIAQRLAGRRMVTLLTGPDGTEMVELAHDALFDEWPRLRGWLNDETAFLEWHHQLRGAVESWESAGRDYSKLLDKAEVSAALANVEKWGNRLMSHELAFIERSRVFNRRVRRILIGVSISVVLIVVATVASLVVVTQVTQRARAAEDARASRDLIRQSSRTDVFHGLPLTMAAYRRSATPESLRALSGWYQRMALVEKIRPGDLSNAAGARLSPDGRYAMGSWSETGMMLWDLEQSARPDIVIDPGAGREASGFAFTSDGSHVVYAHQQQIIFWNVRSRAADHRMPVRTGDIDPVRLIEVAPAGSVLAYYQGDFVYVADTHTGQILAGPLPAEPMPNDRNGFELRFDPQSRYLSVIDAQQDWTVDLHTKRRSAGTAATSPQDPNRPECVTISEGTNQVLGVVDIVVGGRPLVKGLNGMCSHYGLSVDLRTQELVLISYGATLNPLATPTQGPSLEIRSLQDGELRGRFPIPDGGLEGLAPSEQGARLVLRMVEGFILLRVPPPGSLARALTVAESAAITPDGNHVATLFGGNLSLWEANSGQLRRTMQDDRLRASTDPGAYEKPTVIVAPDGGTFAAFNMSFLQTVSVSPPYPVAGWQLNERHGWKPGRRDDNSVDFPSVTASFTGARELLVRAGNIVTRWDVTGNEIGAILGLPADLYDDWTARPGRPQLAVALREQSAVELWDMEKPAKLKTFELAPTRNDGSARKLAFNSDGTLLLAQTKQAPAVVVDVTEGRLVASSPQFGKSQETGETHWDSDFASPVTFMGPRQVLLERWSVDTSYLWTWPRTRLPFVSGDDIAALPMPESGFALATVDYDRKIMLYSTRHAGWRLLPIDSKLWRTSLCVQLTEADMATDYNNGRSSCADG